VSLELTPEGQRAYALLAWGQEDPAERAADAQLLMDDLARPLLGTGGQALREVQDAGRMLHQLTSAGR
jgi:hypothetical protein